MDTKDLTNKCCECGNVYSLEEMVRFGDSWVCVACKPIYVQKMNQEARPPDIMEYAGFWIRARAKVIDGILLSGINIVISLGITHMIMTNNSSTEFIVIQLIQIAIAVSYTTWFLGKYAATPGKMVYRIKVVTSKNERLSYAGACGRYFAEILSGIILGIGYIMAASDDERRTLHDRICNTRVILQ